MKVNPLALIRIVDDDEEMRNSLAFLLTAVGWKVASYKSAQDFLNNDNPLIPGCLILDIRMPKTSGLQLQEKLLCEEYALPIIFITAFAEIETAIGALRKGAVDFLSKPIKDKRLLESVAIAVEKDWNSRSQMREHKVADKLISSLTPRELEIVTLISQGQPNKVISDKLQISEKTVKVHKSAIYRKLGVRTSVEVSQIFETFKES